MTAMLILQIILALYRFNLLRLDLDLQSKPSQGQSRPSCQKSRSKVKRFKGQTNTHVNKRMDTTKSIISLLCLSYAVNKNRNFLNAN